MALHNLKSPAGSRRNIKRVGRGESSGHGKTSCRGHKGQLARSGGGKGPGFEGGQTPLQRRLPKRGFVNPTRVEYQIVNVGALNVFEAGAKVDAAAMCGKGLARHAGRPIKILGEGNLEKKLDVTADKFSASAKEKIAKAGGTAEERSSGVNVQ